MVLDYLVGPVSSQAKEGGRDRCEDAGTMLLALSMEERGHQTRKASDL